MQAEGEVALPSDLLARGYKLIIRAPDRMFAVSPSWGCTGTKTTIADVVAEARSLIRFIEYIEARDSHATDN